MNPLTKVLHEFRAYRPQPHRDFLTHVRETAEKIQTREFFCADPQTAYLYLRVLNHVRSFRWRHWLFTREYIIRKTSHPTATGGSPIVTVCFIYPSPCITSSRLQANMNFSTLVAS